MDPRIREAYALLHSLMEASSGDAASPDAAHAVPWHTTQAPLEHDGDEVSGTDMLALWLPDMASAGDRADPWESYFRAGPTAADPPSPARATLPPPMLDPTPPDESAEAAEELLDDRDAAGAVDGLYAFVHAIGRLDVEAAMACVAEDFHSIADDREIDRGGLRLWLDALFDRLRRFAEVDASLVEIPEPICHPRGVLIHCMIQVDGRSANAAAPYSNETLLFERLAVLNRGASGAWTLDGLGLVGQARS